jgi:hypothetical protein
MFRGADRPFAAAAKSRSYYGASAVKCDLGFNRNIVIGKDESYAMAAGQVDWQMQDAKTRLSEVIERARAEGRRLSCVKGPNALGCLRLKTTVPWRQNRISKPIYSVIQKWTNFRLSVTAIPAARSSFNYDGSLFAQPQSDWSVAVGSCLVAIRS